VLIQTILADMASHIDARHNKGAKFWVKAVAKLLFAPAVQVVVIYRISSALYQNPLTRPLAFILRGFSIVWGGTEIHPAAKIGPGLCLVHSQKVLIGEGVTIGSNVRISHGVSIGGDTGRGGPQEMAGWPTVGDGVTIALDSIVLGPLTIGDGAFIAAQSFVVKDVPPKAVVAGSPARGVRILDDADTVLG
jgi:serine O-acetyltransferase